MALVDRLQKKTGYKSYSTYVDNVVREVVELGAPFTDIIVITVRALTVL